MIAHSSFLGTQEKSVCSVVRCHNMYMWIALRMEKSLDKEKILTVENNRSLKEV